MKNTNSRAAAWLGCALACIALLARDGDALAAAPPGQYMVGIGALAGTVLDTETGLRWQQAVGATGTQAGSVRYCDLLILGGFSDWRLPSVLELASLVDESVASPGPTIDSAAFPLTPSQEFWSSSPALGTPSYGWVVLFDESSALGDDATQMYYARCVR